jgi:carboxyl-terminal processing protease
MNNNSLKLIAPFAFGLVLIVGIMMGRSLSAPYTAAANSESPENTQKLQDILNILDQQYVDSIDREQLFEQTISEMLHRLDPHSNYIAAKDLQSMTESIHGQFGGVGVRFTIIRDTLNITNVIEGSPSYFSGVQQFDQIIEVDGESIANVKLSNTRVQELLKGLEGTTVNVTLLRKGKKLKKTITRGSVPIKSVLAAFMVTDEIGYIRLSQFSVKSDQEFFEAALFLKSKGMKKLIFDLRYNGGGVMSSAVNIADAFLEPGLKIVSTKGKSQPEETLYSLKRPFLGDVKLAVLINGSSASASEIVAGAIQDNDRGIVVGRRSFGKGLVQQDINLKDGSNLRLTISRYYTPTGRSIQRPYSGDYEEYVMEEYNRYESGELYEMDTTLFADSLKYTTPGGRTVYGGGGIMPDVFVPIDTAGATMGLRKFQYSTVISDFAYDYVRSKGIVYPTFQEFAAKFTVSKALLDEFLAYAKDGYEITIDERDLAKSKSVLITDIKAEIARQIWLEDGSLYIRNQRDNEVLKAIEVLK